jgi:Domain of unknown function (DUF4158)
MRRHWPPEDLVEHFTLLPAESAPLAHKAGPTRLGFAVLLKCFQYDGHFPVSELEVPEAVVAHLAPQVGVRPEQDLQYDWSGRTLTSHRAQIRAALGFRQAPHGTRDERAALCFLSKAICRHGVPETITIDGSEANAAAIRGYNEAHGTAIIIRQMINYHQFILKHIYSTLYRP